MMQISMRQSYGKLKVGQYLFLSYEIFYTKQKWQMYVNFKKHIKIKSFAVAYCKP